MNLGILLTVALVAPPSDAPKGTLIAVGGGNMSKELRELILTRAGGPDAPILIIPQSSERPKAGEESANEWKKAGAKSVAILELNDKAESMVKEARFIWIGGGDQNRLMKLLPPKVIDAIRTRYHEGATVGGTSAGAAVQSQVMITGDGDNEVISPNSARVATGFGLWPEVIVDQHFIARQRFNRLLSAVLDKPELLGVGVDEATAVIWHDRTIEVAGAGQVMIIDARIAPKPIASPRSAKDVKLHLLTAGMKFEVK